MLTSENSKTNEKINEFDLSSNKFEVQFDENFADEDFDDFKSNEIVENKIQTQSDGDDDDFGDFDDYQNQTGNDLYAINFEDLPQKAENIILELFPVAKEEVEEFKQFDLLEGNFVYEGLKSITETNALSYHWSKSVSQEMLLKSLNIDTRNIVSLLNFLIVVGL